VRDRLSDEVIDELLAGARTEEEIVGPGGVLAQLRKRLVERALRAELTEYLGYERHQEPPGGTGNTRNGSTAKTVATEHGPVEIKTPSDRRGGFEPQLVRKGPSTRRPRLPSRARASLYAGGRAPPDRAPPEGRGEAL
jgi:putative transposase